VTKKLIEIASEIVQTQVSMSPMSAADITSSLRQVFSTLQELQKAESGEIALSETQKAELPEGKSPAQIAPAESIQNDKVICLECGAEFKQLTMKHLSTHGMNSKEYRKKYGFTMKTPLSAKSITKARSKAAKKRGLPEKLKQYLESKRQQKAEAKAPSPKNLAAAANKRVTVRRRAKKEKGA
jgi:predicted transcriptional regulator